MKKCVFIWLILLLYFSVNFVWAEEAAVDSLFYRGVRLYQEKRYHDALQMLDFLDRVYSNHSRTTATLLMRGKCNLQLGDYQKAINLFLKMIQDHPRSKYFDDALYHLAIGYYYSGSYRKSVFYLFEVIEHSDDHRLMRKSAKLSSDLMDYRLSDDDLRQLLNDVQNERGKAAIIIRLAQREIEQQHFQVIKKTILDFLNDYPKSSYVVQLEQILNQIEKLSKDFMKIGVILPLSGSLSEQAKNFIEGVQYAVNLHNQSSRVKVELVIRDSQGRVLRAIQAAQELCEQEGVPIIIGELESDITAAIAAVAQANDVVLLAPTATENGITEIGNFIFQLNSTLKYRVEMIVDYAISGLGMKQFAILYSADDYGKAMRDAFINNVDILGGEVLVEKWYFEGAKDLGPQFRAIREAGIVKMIEDSLIVIVEEKEEEEEFDTYSGRRDAIFVNQDIESLVDSTNLAVTTIQGIFLPIYNEDLPYIIPQFAFYNLGAQIFGSASWYDLDILENHQKYVDGAIFLSDFYIDPTNFQYYQFRDAYRKVINKTPERMEIFGYDAVNLILQIVSEEALNSEEIRNRLSSNKKYEGIRGVIAFNQERVNPHMRLLQYRSNKIILIK